MRLFPPSKWLALTLAAWSFYGCRPQAAPQSVPGAIHYVIGCSVLDERKVVIRVYPGKFCLFLEDGSFVSAQEPATLSRVSARGEVMWERKISVHHQLRLSRDGKQLLTLGSIVRPGERGKTRYDLFTVLDLASGKTLHEWSAYDHRKELLALAGALRFSRVAPGLRAHLDFEGEYTHFNSIQEIGENAAAAKIPALSPGNYLVGLNGLGYVGVLNHDLTKLIWTRKIEDSPVQFHDAQILPNGDLLVYNNRTGNADPFSTSGLFSIERIDPSSGQVRWRFPKEPAKGPLVLESGGVQWLGDGYLFNLNTSSGGGVAHRIDTEGRELWSFPNPSRDASGKPFDFQDIQQLDLSRFLATSRL